jgi:hypothetical protein
VYIAYKSYNGIKIRVRAIKIITAHAERGFSSKGCRSHMGFNDGKPLVVGNNSEGGNGDWKVPITGFDAKIGKMSRNSFMVKLLN